MGQGPSHTERKEKKNEGKKVNKLPFRFQLASDNDDKIVPLSPRLPGVYKMYRFTNLPTTRRDRVDAPTVRFLIGQNKIGGAVAGLTHSSPFGTIQDAKDSWQGNHVILTAVGERERERGQQKQTPP